jgi:hypothetical protein
MECTDCIRLADAARSLEFWKPPEIMVELQKGEEGELLEVNLVSIVDEIPSSAERHKFMQEKSNRFYMSKYYNRNDLGYRRDQIVPFFAKACAKVGIEIRSKGWEEIPQKLTLKCVRGRLYSSQQSKKNQQVQKMRQGVGRKEFRTYSNTPAVRAEFLGYMIPKFAWVRTVKVSQFNGCHYLICSCGLFDRFGWPCRHCYKVRESVPTPQDCIVRSRIDYLRYFNKPGYDKLSCMQEQDTLQ